MPDLPPYLSNAYIDRCISAWLEEDIGPGDLTTLATIPSGRKATAELSAKSQGVVAGLYVADRVFRQVEPELSISWHLSDGETVDIGFIIGHIAGPARGILIAERLALNIVQRMSGIATATRRMVEAVGHSQSKILDTRKTAPGLRLFDKWAVRLGGGGNHRIGLFDMMIVKDNHIASAGGLRNAVAKARQFRDNSDHVFEIEVEARTLQEVEEAAGEPGIDRILLDNLVTIGSDGQANTALLEEAVRIVGGRIPTEASGNVTLDTVSLIAATGVDYISSGALTHSVHALDISLRIDLA